MADSGAEMYLDLLKRAVVNTLYRDPPIPTPWRTTDAFDRAARELGRDWPSQAHSMIGFRRLENLRALLEGVLADGVPGDVLEAGVARGGAMVYARGVLRAHGVTDRTIWLADSFQGFPEPDEHQAPETFHPELAEDLRKFQEVMAEREVDADDLYGQFLVGTSEAEVRDTFDRYGLLDDRVRFLAGWFADTLPAAPVERLAVLRVDADLYDSTQVALESLYPKVSAGGYVIIDDYQSVDQCRRAVHDYLKTVEEDPELVVVDEDAVYWRKERA